MTDRVDAAALNDLIASTLESKHKTIVDQIRNKSDYFRAIERKGYIKKITGGSEGRKVIVGDNDSATTQRKQGVGGAPATLSLSYADDMNTLYFDWAQYFDEIVLAKDTILCASGPEAVIDYVMSKVELAKGRHATAISRDLVGLQSSTLGMLGLQDLIADDPTTGSIGGIDRSTNTWARNQMVDASDLSITPSATTIEGLFHLMMTKLKIDGNKPELIVCDSVFYSYFREATRGREMYINTGNGDSNFSLKFDGVEVVEDTSTTMPASHAYFISPNTIKYEVQRDRWMSRRFAGIGLDISNQDAYVQGIESMICAQNHEPRKTGVLKA